MANLNYDGLKIYDSKIKEYIGEKTVPDNMVLYEVSDNTENPEYLPLNADILGNKYTADILDSNFNDLASMERITTIYVPSQSYSSSEEQVIGKWIDGRPIYRRTITVDSISTSGNNIVDIENANIDCPVRLFGSCIFTTSNKRILLNYGITENQAATDIELYYNSENQILIGCNDPTKYTNFIIVTEYTKSTDEENSFDPDMLDKETYTELEMNALIESSVSEIWGSSEGAE